MSINNPTFSYSPPQSPSTPPSGSSPGTLGISNGSQQQGDYWGSVSSFIGSFLRRRPTISELPGQVYEVTGTPLVLRSCVIVSCISYLKEREAYLLEGIFRLSGLATEVRTVCESFKSESFDIEWVKNPHTIATVLKQYCRFAHPPIIPSAMCIPWAELMRSTATEGEILDSIAKGIYSLPPEHRFIMGILCSFIKLVLDHHDINKMASHNLSVVWGPNLINFQLPDLDAFSEANLQASLMNLILTHMDDLHLWTTTTTTTTMTTTTTADTPPFPPAPEGRDPLVCAPSPSSSPSSPYPFRSASPSTPPTPDIIAVPTEG